MMVDGFANAPAVATVSAEALKAPRRTALEVRISPVFCFTPPTHGLGREYQ
jgi:hypothetical protein